MEKVYLLWHTHLDENLDGGESFKLIGTYSSRSLAEDALERASKLTGFKDHLDGFEIDEYILNDDHWTSGFITE